jgi:hypothetical protein
MLLRSLFGDAVDHLGPAPQAQTDEDLMDIAPYQVHYRRFNRVACSRRQAS